MQWLVVIFICLVALAYLIQGIGWLFSNYWPQIVFGALGLMAAWFFVLALVSSFSGKKAAEVKQAAVVKKVAAVKKEVAEVEVVAAKAATALQQLAKDRQVIERQARELESLGREVRGAVNFELLIARHNKSRLLADSWYDHKRQAVDSRKELSNGVKRLRHRLNELRGERSAALASNKASVDHLSTVVRSLNQEIDRSGAALDKYNQQTGALSLHIGTTCGPRGERWYADLQDRKRRRELDRQRR
jgi:chromosome segregation ATPase